MTSLNNNNIGAETSIKELSRVNCQLEVKKMLDTIQFPYINKMYVYFSASTSSVYGVAVFKKKHTVFPFAIKSHVALDTSVSKVYLTQDYKGLGHIKKELEKDLNSAYKKMINAVDVRLNLVEYELLNTLAKTYHVLKVDTTVHNKVVHYWFELDGEVDKDYKIPNLNTREINYLINRNFLMDKTNDSIIKTLVVTKVGYLALTRSAKLFSNDKFLTNSIRIEGLYA